MRFLFPLLFQLVLTGSILAQNQDSTLNGADSLQPGAGNHSLNSSTRQHVSVSDSASIRSDSVRNDSISKRPTSDLIWTIAAAGFSDKDFIRLGFNNNKFFSFSSLPVAITSDKKRFKGKEVLFYTLIVVFLFFAFLRLSFPKYLVDLFQVAFRTTLKQRQISEQLVQAPLPSLLFNFFFLISSSFYLSFVLEHYDLTAGYSFWALYVYCFAGLAVIYIIKLLSLKFSGWLFNISATTDGYIFIVFMINKIIGIYLLPFLVLLAFTDNDLYTVAFVISYLGVFALLAYRFILSYALIQNQMRLNPFHFFLYLCAFEIVPLFLIYKALLLWF
jgi:hypothetical protein